MKRNISISVPEDMYKYMLTEGRYTSMSEYVRALVTRDRQRREDDKARPFPAAPRMGELFVLTEALEHLDKLRSVLERRDIFDD